MAFTIYFKKSISEPDHAIKEFDAQTPTVEKTCTPYEPLDDLNGYVIVDYNANLLAYNYAEYDGKKYFITDRIRQTGGRLKIMLRIDSLSTYWGQIKECDAIANSTTNEQGWTSMVQGNRLIYAFGVNHASQLNAASTIDFDSGRFYLGIYG